MRSHLTRRVFRRLLLNQPLVVHRHLHRTARPLVRPPSARVVRTCLSSRTFFFGIFSREPDDPQSLIVTPGMVKMLELDKRIHLIARLPPQSELVLAFNRFIQAKSKTRQPIEDFHAARLLQTLETLEKRHEPKESPSLDKDSLRAALKALSGEPEEGYTKVHNQLARALWTALCNRYQDGANVKAKGDEITEPKDEAKAEAKARDDAKEESQDEAQTGSPATYVPRELISVLCGTGEPLEARGLLEALPKPSPEHQQTRARSWALVLAEFSKQNDENNFRETVDMMSRLGIDHTKDITRTLAVHSARRDDVQETKKWYSLVDLAKPNSRLPKSSFIRDDRVYQALMEFCLRNGEMEWGRQILKPAEGEKTSFNKWDAIFRASAATGRSFNEVDRMMAVMNRRADETGQEELRPDINTFNGLIRFALSKPDAYLAERYFNLMEKWNIEPDVESYCLQVEYRLAAGDLEGAFSTYDLLRRENIPQDEDWPIMNKLVQALLASPNVSNKAVTDIVEDILDKKIGIPAPTVLALCRYHLQRDEYARIVSLLNNSAFQFSTSQRTQIRNMMFDFTLNPQTDVGRAWDTYMIFHQIFDIETGRDIRNTMITLFFSLQRPDLGTHVFTAMSKHVRADTRPNLDTYVRAFEGVAATGDQDALEIIHNLLKLDTDVEPCTRLHNCMMLAYAACERHRRALDFWHEIAISAEGPTYNSLKIAFRISENLNFGHRIARPIWEKLKEADIEIDKSLLKSYVACMARQNCLDDVQREMKAMKEMTGEEPDADMIGTMYNACSGLGVQARVAGYLRETYPKLWAQLEAKGFDENWIGARTVRGIDRALETS